MTVAATAQSYAGGAFKGQLVVYADHASTPAPGSGWGCSTASGG